MRVKRYVADSIQEAIARVKNDLGRNAIILHTKPFKEGGFLGFFSKRRFEVIAAVDEDTISDGIKKHVEKLEPVAAPVIPPPLPIPAPVVAMEIPLVVASPVTPPINNGVAEMAATAAEPALDSIREEIAEMKELIRQVAARPTVVTVEQQREYTGPLVELRQQLLRLGMESELIDYLFVQLPPHLIDPDHFSRSEVMNYFQQIIAAKLMFSDPIQSSGGASVTGTTRPQIAALIGPTGVGKTTTIAKLAANYSLFEKKKVGLVTIDTYRIAAVEHLKTYGDIINLPVEVVYAPGDLTQAFDNLKDCDLILIDTAGRSPHNQAMMDELHRFIDHPEVKTIILVISATTQYQDMIDIETKFGKIAYTHLLFTKLDETSCLGPVVSLAWKVKRPISYLTNGQNVPDDIEVAKPDQITTQMFKGISNG